MTNDDSQPRPASPQSSVGIGDAQSALGHFGWLRFIGLAIVFYFAFLVLWWYALDALTFVAGNIAGWVYGLVDSSTSISTHEKLVIFSVRAGQNTEFAGQARTTALHVGRITYGLPMFAAMAAATRTHSLWGKAKSAGFGLLVFVVLSVPAVMIWAKMLGVQLEDQIAAVSQGTSETRASFFYYAFHGYAFSQPVIAVALWMAVVLLGLFKKISEPVNQPSPVSANSPCPCGNGRKYRRCRGKK